MQELENDIIQAKENGDSTTLLNRLRVRGNIYSATGKPLLAIPDLEESLSLAHALNDTLALLISRRWYLVALYQLGKGDAATSQAEILLQESVQYHNSEHQAWALVGLAHGDRLLQNLEESRLNYSKAADLHRDNQDYGGELFALNGLGIVLDNLGEYDEALKVFQRVSETALILDRPYIAGLAENNHGSLMMALGNPAGSVERFHRSEELFRADLTELDWIIPVNNRAWANAMLGQFELATDICNDLLLQARKLGAKNYEVRIMSRLAEIKVLQGRQGEGKQILNKILQQMDPEPLLKFESIKLLTEILSKQNETQQALLLLDQNNSWLKELENARTRIHFDLLFGSLKIKTKAWPEAQPVLQRAVNSSREMGLKHELLQGLGLLSQVSKELGFPLEALVHLEEASTVWASLRSLPREYHWREVLGSTTQSHIQDQIRLILEYAPGLSTRQRQQQALDVSLFYKSRTLQERLRGPGALPNVLMENGVSIDLDILQNQVLKKDEILFDVIVGESGSFLFAISKTQFLTEWIPMADGIDERIYRFLELIQAPSRSEKTPNQSVSSAVVKSVAAALGDDLLGPIKQVLQEYRSVIFVPDGSWHLLPLELLLSDTSGSAPVVQRVPAISFLADNRLLQKSFLQHNSLKTILVGNASNNSQSSKFGEIEHLSKTYQGMEQNLALPSPNEPAGSQLTNFDILHFATHSEVNPEFPWQSSLFLDSADSSATGSSLRAKDIVELELNARLAVLASCESGSGRVLKSEGVLGLGSAFLGAGVPTVVASLWPVDDQATAQLMEIFYKGLSKRKTVAQSLQTARLHLARNSDTAAPFFWAGFVVIGDGDLVIPLEKKNLPRYWLIFPLFAAVVLFLAWNNRRRFL
ncbi:MAG: CHAT domain-containing protein [bacterium]|nr:CHAT domain-containing protein [bacterium]